MSEQIILETIPAPEVAAKAPTKWERESQAFHVLLPQLLNSVPGKYVAVHERKVIDSDVDEMALIMRVVAKLGNVDFHVGYVGELSEPVFRSGVIRELKYRPAMSA